MKPIPYRLSARFSDWYHGLRDGWAGIPDRDVATRHLTTPHREMLIRLAQEVFEYERLGFEQARGDAPERMAGVSARLDQLSAHRAETERHLAEAGRPLSVPEQTWRRIGDLDVPELVVVQRRQTEHRRRMNAARYTLDSIIAEIAQAEADLAKASEADRRELQVASTRVLRFHEYVHRRLDCYLRSLMRAHSDGAWAGAHLVVPSFLPGWIGLDSAVPSAKPWPPPADDESPGEDDDDEPSKDIALNHPVTRFGSNPEPGEVDELIPAAGIAPLHFTLTREDGGVRLRDRGHGHGPYRYGQQVTSALLTAGDHFDIADYRYYVTDDCAGLKRSPLGQVNLIAANVYAKPPRASAFSRKRTSKVLLAGMTFMQHKKTLVAVLGRSGAGKSSLLNALIGDLPVDSDSSLFLEGLDMRSRSAQISDKLGYVPQDTALYTSLTVRQLLTYSFHLRDPGSTYQRTLAIERVCGWLQLREQQLDQLASTLSGGQLKRVSIAVELLSEPKLLILDEPTSGLDPGMDREIMRQLRDYAHKGNTVILTTHATEHLRDAGSDVLIVADGGRPIFFGHSGRVLRHLGVRRYADLMDKLTPAALNEDPNTWPDDKAAEYQNSEEAKEARREAEKAKLKLPAAAGKDGAAPVWLRWVRRPAVPMFRRQLWTLLKRQATLLRMHGRAGNPPGPTFWSTVVALLPVLVTAIAAFLAAQITPGDGLGARPGQGGSIALGVLTTLAILSGQALTYGDLVSDFTIIHREHRTGAILPVVVLSKWLIYAGVAVIQAAVMTFVFIWWRPGPAYANVLPPIAELFTDLAVLTVAAMSLGLLISALARKLEQAVAIVTLTSITQIALNGSTAPVSRAMNWVAVLLPDRWGLASAASSVDLGRITRPRLPPDALWRHTSGQWTSDMLTLVLLTIAYSVLATIVLRRRLRPRPSGRRIRLRPVRQP